MGGRTTRRGPIGAAVAGLLAAACGGAAPAPASPPAALIHGAGTVKVEYAGSLVQVFEKRIAPAFDAASGFTYQGEGKGSVAIANEIKDHTRQPDVFVSADPAVNQTLQGPANGGFVSWWVPFARTEMVIAWSPKSSFVTDFQAAKAGRKAWESVLQEPGIKLGRTDPQLDPKGYRTLWLFQLDRERTGSDIAQNVLGAPENPAQIFPEEQLVARLQNGDLDAAFFYTVEAVEARLPFLTLPSSINQGDPAQAAHYATVSFTNQAGKTFKGSPILYTVTIPTTATNQPGARSFVQLLLGPTGQGLLNREGLLATPALVSGDPRALPPDLKPLTKA